MTKAAIFFFYLHKKPVNIICALTLNNVTKLPLKTTAIVTGTKQLGYFFCGGGVIMGQWRHLQGRT